MCKGGRHFYLFYQADKEFLLPDITTVMRVQQCSSVLSTLSFTFPPSLRGGHHYHYPHFTDEESQVQGPEVICLRSHNLNLELLAP